jgi:hypothetical protein
MAVDFVSALRAAWDADAGPAAAGIVPLHFGIDPGSNYPYAVMISLGSKITNRNFGSCQIHEDHYRLNVLAASADGAVAAGAAARAFLESLRPGVPAFDDGRLVDAHQTGGDLLKLPRAGRDGTTFVWLSSLTWMVRIARDRSS